MPEGITFGISGASIQNPAPSGSVVNVTWEVTFLRPARKFALVVSDGDGLEVEQFVIDLTGQVSPSNGLWKFVIPPGIEPDIWTVRGTFYAEGEPDEGPHDTGAVRFVVKPVPFVGTILETIKVFKEFK